MAENISLTNLVNLSNQTTAVNAINSNNTTITNAFKDVMSLTGVAPNQMQATLDMNSNAIINLPAPVSTNSPLRLQDAATLNGGGTISGLPVGGTVNQVLAKNSSTNYDVSWSSVGSGTVTSVGLSLPSDFTISNSPITTSGTLTGVWTTPPTGTGAIVRTSSPTLLAPILNAPTMTAPVLGVALATSLNGSSIAPGQYTGTSTNDNATAGNIGEFINASVGSGAPIVLTSGTPSNIVSMSLTAGDWDVWGATEYTCSATTSVTLLIGAINTTSAFIPTSSMTGTGSSVNVFTQPAEVPTNLYNPNYILPLPICRLSLSAITTVYLISQATFTASTLNTYGFIAARRVR